jgi:hypothetical protein
MDKLLKEKNMTNPENKLKSDLFYSLYVDCLKFKMNETNAKDIDCKHLLLQHDYYNKLLHRN